MYAQQYGTDVIIGFDSKEEAEALFAVMNGIDGQIDPKQAEYGKWLYKWFYDNVQKLATNYEAETAGFMHAGKGRHYYRKGNKT